MSIVDEVRVVYVSMFGKVSVLCWLCIIIISRMNGSLFFIGMPITLLFLKEDIRVGLLYVVAG